MSGVADNRPAGGLFSDLSRRFSPDAEPGIRPRPQALFEGSEESAELHEVNEEITAKRTQQKSEQVRPAAVALPPVEPVPGRHTPSQPLPAAQTPVAAAQVEASQPSDAQTPLPAPLPTAAPAVASDRVDRDDTSIEPAPAVVATTGVPNAGPGEAPLTKVVEVPASAAVTTVPVETSAPLETRQPAADRPDRDADSLADARTVEQPAAPTIHIGKIELHQPPQAQPPPKPVPVAAGPRRRPAATRSAGTQGSRLTEYLGWKK